MSHRKLLKYENFDCPNLIKEKVSYLKKSVFYVRRERRSVNYKSMQKSSNNFSKILELLFESKVHMGHKGSHWNPLMAQYLVTQYKQLHLINLEQTIPLLKRALTVLDKIYSGGNNILVVGNNRSNNVFVSDLTKRNRVYGITKKWIGGSLTNWDPRNFSYTIANLEPPQLMVVLNTNENALAISEAQKVGIPIIGILDSNSSPKGITYPIPGNDDSPRSQYLYFKLMTEVLDK
jgi:small subunit ribosomal protein S2